MNAILKNSNTGSSGNVANFYHISTDDAISVQTSGMNTVFYITSDQFPTINLAKSGWKIDFTAGTYSGADRRFVEFYTNNQSSKYGAELSVSLDLSSNRIQAVLRNVGVGTRTIHFTTYVDIFLYEPIS